MRLLTFQAVLVLLCTISVATDAVRGDIIDFEGVAPSGGVFADTQNTRTFGDFDVYVSLGWYIGSANPLIGEGTYPNNTTDWLMNDNADGVLVTKTDGGVFSAVSFDASEWLVTNFSGETAITVTGHLSGGGTVVQDFTTDTTFSFETFNLNSSFTNLTQLRIADATPSPGTSMAWDNIVLTEIPEPSTVAMWSLFGLIGGVVAVRRRMRA